MDSEWDLSVGEGEGGEGGVGGETECVSVVG